MTSKNEKKTCTTQNLYTWNFVNTRIVPFHQFQRFDSAVPILPNRGNQYSSITFVDYLNQSYQWLIKSTRIISSPPAGHFQCWVPYGVGIQPLVSGYNRFSFRGTYYMCHVFVWLFHHPNQALTQDISHLCSNKACCRPSHLLCEHRNYNISRRGCPGYLVSNEDNHFVIKICLHHPPCSKTTPFSSDNYIDPLNYE